MTAVEAEVTCTAKNIEEQELVFTFAKETVRGGFSTCGAGTGLFLFQ